MTSWKHEKIAYPYDHQVQEIPEVHEVLELVGEDLQSLLHYVVDDEEDKDDLTGHEKVVLIVGVLQQADGGHILVGQHPSGGGKFKRQSVEGRGEETIIQKLRNDITHTQQF